jgi:protein required for attachment to host cells
MRNSKTAFATFNGAVARAFLYDRAAKKLTPLAGFPMEGDRKPEFDDRAGRLFQSFSDRRSAAEPKTNPEKGLERQFVQAVASRLDELRETGAFNRLIVAATPRALGFWRESVPQALAAAVRTEVAADHVNSDDGTLLKTIENAILPPS